MYKYGTSTKFPIKPRVDGSLIVRVVYEGLVAARGASFHGGVEAARPIEHFRVAPRASRSPDAFPASRFAGARILCEKLRGALT